jgi:STAM-binding protein
MRASEDLATEMEESTEYLKGKPFFRRLKIPRVVIEKFSLIADSNTELGIETCGVLAGKLSHNILEITTLIVPRQTGTSDTCSMSHEEQLVQLQDAHDLLTLGWIHTHPTQDCFLSSVDLHTHYGFQALMPESLAIVLAPRDSNLSYGIFRIDNMELLANCSAIGFHTHTLPDSKIYHECSDSIDWLDSSIDIFDLRIKN